MSYEHPNKEEMKLREGFSKAISEGIRSGMTTGDIIVTVLELTRIAAEGSMVACDPKGLDSLKQSYALTLQGLIEHLNAFNPPTEKELRRLAELGREELEKAGFAKGVAWGKGEEKEVLH